MALNGDELADVRNSAMSGKDDVPLAPAVTASSPGPADPWWPLQNRPLKASHARSPRQAPVSMSCPADPTTAKWS